MRLLSFFLIPAMLLILGCEEPADGKIYDLERGREIPLVIQGGPDSGTMEGLASDGEKFHGSYSVTDNWEAALQILSQRRGRPLGQDVLQLLEMAVLSKGERVGSFTLVSEKGASVDGLFRLKRYAHENKTFRDNPFFDKHIATGMGQDQDGRRYRLYFER